MTTRMVRRTNLMYKKKNEQQKYIFLIIKIGNLNNNYF